MINEDDFTLQNEIWRLANPIAQSSISINRFREVARLYKGDSFGELSLLKNNKRSATIECIMPSMFVTLTKKDYDHDIRQEEKRKDKEVTNFFRGFRIFANLRASVIIRIAKHMKRM